MNLFDGFLGSKATCIFSMKSNTKFGPCFGTKNNGIRNYALMRYDDVYIKPDYEAPPRFSLSAKLRESVISHGKYYARATRKRNMIPGVLYRDASKPYLLELNPNSIWSIMNKPDTRFLGRRYFLNIEQINEEYEVIPQLLDVDHYTYYPRSVVFITYDPSKIPAMKIPLRIHDKFFESTKKFPTIEEMREQKAKGTYQYIRYLKDKTDDDADDD